MKLWLPKTREEILLNVVAFVLVLLLLAIGFEILKLPAVVAPDRPVAVLVIGYLALHVLGLLIAWIAARDDFLRIGHGLPRVIATNVLVALLASVAFLVRSLVGGAMMLDAGAPIDSRQLLAVMIGGQFAALGFFATYAVKKNDTAKVRDFKRLAGAITAFCRDVRSEKLKGAGFNAAFGAIKKDMKAMPEIANAVRLAVDKAEGAYASAYADASDKLADYLGNAPTDSAVRDIVRQHKDLFDAIAGRADRVEKLAT